VDVAPSEMAELRDGMLSIQVSHSEPCTLDPEPRTQNPEPRYWLAVGVDDGGGDLSYVYTMFFIRACNKEGTLDPGTIPWFTERAIERGVRMMVIIQVAAPARAISGVESVTVWAGPEGERGRVGTEAFSFAYSQPPRIVAPVDGSVEGGALVSVKAYGIDPIPSQSELLLTIFDGTAETPLSSANVLALTTNVQAGLISEMTLSLLMPAFPRAGVFTCRIMRVVEAESELLTDFLFEYFDAPAASNLEQSAATVQGQTANPKP